MLGYKKSRISRPPGSLEIIKYHLSVWLSLCVYRDMIFYRDLCIILGRSIMKSCPSLSISIHLSIRLSNCLNYVRSSFFTQWVPVNKGYLLIFGHWPKERTCTIKEFETYSIYFSKHQCRQYKRKRSWKLFWRMI